MLPLFPGALMAAAPLCPRHSPPPSPCSTLMLAALFSTLQSASFSLLNDNSLNFLEGVPHKARVTMRKHVIDAVMVCACCKGGEGGGGAYDTIS